MLALLLALPVSYGQDKKAPPPKEQYAALEKEHATQQKELIAEARKAKGDEQQKLIQKYYDLSKDFAAKFHKLAEDHPKDPAAGDALAWIVLNAYGSPLQEKAGERLVDQFPDHPGVVRVLQSYARNQDGETKLKGILDKAETRPSVKAAAALALGEKTARWADRLGDKPEAEKAFAEADKYFTRAIELAKDSPAVKADAERLLNAMRNLRVGKEAPDIKAADLDGKEFKLSDYRGKVVLLDFWGDW